MKHVMSRVSSYTISFIPTSLIFSCVPGITPKIMIILSLDFNLPSTFAFSIIS